MGAPRIAQLQKAPLCKGSSRTILLKRISPPCAKGGVTVKRSDRDGGIV